MNKNKQNKYYEIYMQLSMKSFSNMSMSSNLYSLQKKEKHYTMTMSVCVCLRPNMKLFISQEDPNWVSPK